MLGDMMYLMNTNSVGVDALDIDPAQFADFIKAVKSGVINRTAARGVFEKIFASHDFDVNEYIRQNGLTQIDDETRIREIAGGVIAANPDSVSEYKSGKTKVFAFFVGQTMRNLHGKANPAIVNAVVTEMLNNY
jgi:aspartyl-tRNA(Asn)/glutamyl-tRNA(Gln) amidotransferase subunit B